MYLAQKYTVPAELALLYDFLNSLDLRSYAEKGADHEPSDELATPAQLEGWMRDRGLLPRGARVSIADHRRALELRSAIRSFVQLPPQDRPFDRTRARRLNRASEAYRLVVKISDTGALSL